MSISLWLLLGTIVPLMAFWHDEVRGEKGGNDPVAVAFGIILLVALGPLNFLGVALISLLRKY